MLGRHHTNLSLHDEIIDFLKDHSDRKYLKFSTENLMHQKSFTKKLEHSPESTPMKPKDIDVKLTSGATSTVSVFDLQAMSLSLLSDDTLMKEENLADEYNYLTGHRTEDGDIYGEIHIRESWEKARNYFCGNNNDNMPIALIVFGDKSHLDLHGSLAIIPLTFTLSCFNRDARGRKEFWRPFA